MNQINSILVWCDTHISIVKVLKKNFDEFVQVQVPKIHEFYTQRQQIAQVSEDTSKAIDELMFMLGMLGPNNFLQIVSHQIARLKLMASHVIALKSYNNFQMQHIVEQLGEGGCARLRRLHST